VVSEAQRGTRAAESNHPPAEPDDAGRSWVGVLVVGSLLVFAGAAAFMWWPRAEPAATSLVATDAASIDAMPADAVGHDALADATPTDAVPVDAITADAMASLAGRDLAVFVMDALNRNKLDVAIEACRRGVLAADQELSQCVVSACKVGEAGLARRWAALLRHQPTRERMTRICRGNGIDLAGFPR
jgi:hypothetical protein